VHRYGRPVGYGPNSSALLGWLLVFGVSLSLYAATANRGAQWQDSGFLILSIVTGQLVRPLGLALTHPLHYWLGRLAIWPAVCEPSLAITLVSSLAAALAVANVYGCVRCLTGRNSAALFAAASLAVAHTFWRMATLTEVYTITAALLAGECWALAAFLQNRRPSALWTLALLNGLGIANHLQGGLTTPVLFVVTLWALRSGRITRRHAGMAAALWGIGTLPYTALVASVLISSGDWAGTLGSALFGAGSKYGGYVLNMTLSFQGVLVSLGFGALSFPNLLMFAAGYGLARYRRIGISTSAGRALLAGLLIHALFVCRYNVIDQHTFFLPTYVLLAVFAGIGAAGVCRWPRSKLRRRVTTAAVLLLLATPGVYALAAPIARHFNVLARFIRHKPYRDDYVYLLTPWSVVERSAERMSREAVTLAGPRGLILVEDGMASFAIAYRALRAGWPELQIKVLSASQRDKILANARQEAKGGRRVVLVPENVERQPPPHLLLTRRGDLYTFDRTARGP